MTTKTSNHTFSQFLQNQHMNKEAPMTNDFIISHQYDSYTATKDILLSGLAIVVSFTCFLVLILLITICIKHKFYAPEARPLKKWNIELHCVAQFIPVSADLLHDCLPWHPFAFIILFHFQFLNVCQNESSNPL